jgi:hypothetical protein
LELLKSKHIPAQGAGLKAKGVTDKVQGTLTSDKEKSRGELF